MMIFTPIGFIPLGFFNATIVHVPVIIGSIILGPRIGAVLGALFGAGSLIRATMSPNLLSFAFSPFIPAPGSDGGSPWALLICFVPRILVGIAPYYANAFLSRFAEGSAKWRYVTTFASGVLGSMTNTILVLGLISMLLKDAYAAATGLSAAAVNGAILSVVAVNGIPEAIVAGLFTSAVTRALRSLKTKGK
jgi:uncharacterized membrane protein